MSPSLDFRLLFESLPGLYIILTPDFRIVAVSDAYLRAAMRTREEILGRNIFDIFPENPADPGATGARNLRESLEQVLKSGEPDAMAVQRYDIQRPQSQGDGYEQRYWSLSSSPVYGAGGPGARNIREVAYIIHRVEDVTEFFRLQQEGREREKRTEGLRARADQMESEIYLRSRELDEANRRLRAANEDLQRFYRQITALMPQAGNEFESVSDAEDIDFEGILARLSNLIAEQRRLEEQLRQSQKMEAIGRLAGGVAHDFNNILTVITGFANMVIERLPEGPLADYVKEIDRAAMRAAGLTRQLLTFSRKQLLQPRLLDLNEVIAGMEELMRRLIGDNVTLVTALSGGICKVKADRGQIEQVIMNLAVNARDAMPSGGRLLIETRNVHPPPNLETKAQYCAMLTVSDTGEGMDAETLSHIFEPFFTTKEVGKGTGLGLSTVYGVVEQSGGVIAVDSKPGRGSVFRVYFPMAADGIDEETSERTHGPHHSGTGTILVVEDETPVRRLVSRILTGAHYRVLQAANGQEALIMAAKHATPIDLLITDVLMPGISGLELVDELRKSRPDLIVLFMSGYDRELLGQRESTRSLGFLPKPFTPQALLTRVHELLEGGDARPEPKRRSAH